ncbi:MAG: NAD(P)/FAD-dependent oxidoreductase [Candidatus Binatia bacterium]
MQNFDVAIIGAGPAGSATAIGLVRLGYHVALIDKKQFPREKLCGDFVNPVNWSVFQELGIEDRILAQPHAKVTGFRITTAAGREAIAQFNSLGRERAVGLGLRRVHLDQVLLEQAAELGVTVRQGRRIEDLSRTAQGWRLANSDESLGAKILIGADGRNSWVAQRLDLNSAASINGRAIGFQTRLRIPRPQTPPLNILDYQTCTLSRVRERARVRVIGGNNATAPLLSFRGQATDPAQWRNRSLDPSHSLRLTSWSQGTETEIVTGSEVEIHLFPGGYAGVVGLGDGTINLCLAIDKQKLPSERNTGFLFANILAQNPYLKDILERSKDDPELRSVYPVYFSQRRCYDDGVLLVGDAARVSEPVTGEGVYFAMRSGLLAAEVSAEALALNDLSASFLRRYEERCNRVFRSRMSLNAVLRFAIYRPAFVDPLIGLSATNDRMLNSLIGFVCAPEAARQ